MTATDSRRALAAALAALLLVTGLRYDRVV